MKLDKVVVFFTPGCLKAVDQNRFHHSCLLICDDNLDKMLSVKAYDVKISPLGDSN